MGTVTKISFDEFRRLQDAADPWMRYELDEGDVIVTPSPTPYHNIVRYRLRRALTDFVQAHDLGLILDETDFLLSPNTVRKPDIAFIPKEKLKGLDIYRCPIEVPPALAIEVISPSNLAQDTLKKVRQYVAGGAGAVWLVYPSLHLVEVHDPSGIRVISEPASLIEERLFAGLSFHSLLTDLFAEDPTR